MNRHLFFTFILIALSVVYSKTVAQSNQTVVNGATTTAVAFPGTNCVYNWANSNPSIGLSSSGTGSIASFTAINNSNVPVTATITATPSAAGFAYMPIIANSVSIISTATNTVIGNTPVGANPTDVCVSPNGNFVYVANFGSGTVSVINTSSNTTTATITVGSKPLGLCVSPDGTLLYVANAGSNTVSVISLATNTVVKTITVGTYPIGLSFTHDGKHIYVANELSNNVYVIDAASNTLSGNITTPASPGNLTITPNDGYVYVSCASYVSVISTATNTVVTNIGTAYTPLGIAASPDGSKVYFVNNPPSNSAVYVINTATNVIVNSIPIGTSCEGLSVSPDGSEVIVSNFGSNSAVVISTVANTVTTRVPLTASPAGVGNFITGGNGCNSSPITFTITVNPTPSSISVGAITGNIAACAGSASTSPNIERINVTGINLTNDVTATAPAGFEVSLSANSGYAGAVTLMQAGGKLADSVLYVRSASSAVSGASGNLTLASAGATTQNVALVATINTLPVANPVPNQTVANGVAITPIKFTGTANKYSWTNDTPGIGLPANGIGDISAFKAINTTGIPITATITTVPSSTGYAYITNTSADTVTVVNAATNLVVATIPVGAQPFGVSVSPDGNGAYITNQGSNTVSVINTTTNVVIATVNVGISPYGLIVSPDGSHLYVCNAGAGANSVSVISTTTNSVSGTITVGKGPSGVAISPDGNWLYVTNFNSNTVSVISTQTNTVTATIPVGSSPVGVVVTPDGTQVFVTNYYSNTISVISTATNTVTATLVADRQPYAIAITPNGKYVYVSNYIANTISVINTAGYSIVATIPAGSHVSGLSVSPDGGEVFVTNQGLNTVSIVSTSTNKVTGSVTVGANPLSFGNFITVGTGCTGPPISFTITVDPSAYISTTGTIPALNTVYGTASPTVSFSVSGINMTSAILVTPPAGFEVSTDNVNFSPTVSFGSAGTIGPVTVYVKIASNVAAGFYSGNIVLSSTGGGNATVQIPNSAVSQAVLTITADSVSKTVGQVLNGGSGSTAFTVSGLQNNETVGTVSINYGNGAAATDPIGVYKGSVTPSAVTGGTFNLANYVVNYVNGDIRINVGPVISVSGILAPLNTVYGTPSSSESFTVSGTKMSAGILVTPAAGFEVSTDNINFSSTVTVGGAGTIVPTPVYIRLAATTGAGSYGGSNLLSSLYASGVVINIPGSMVNPTPLTITADNKTKNYGAVNPTFTAGYSGFVNNDNALSLTTQPVFTTTAVKKSPAGQYPITVSGAASFNYTFTYVNGVLTINPGPPDIVIPSAFTPNGDGINDVWNITGLNFYTNSVVDIYNRNGQLMYHSVGYAKPWDGTLNGSALPIGAYYYVIDSKSDFGVLSGSVSIIR